MHTPPNPVDLIRNHAEEITVDLADVCPYDYYDFLHDALYEYLRSRNIRWIGDDDSGIIFLKKTDGEKFIAREIPSMVSTARDIIQWVENSGD